MICRVCKEEKPVELMTTRHGEPENKCRACHAARMRAYKASRRVPRPPKPKPEELTEKKCSRCKLVLPVSNFKWKERSKSRRNPCWESYCKACDAKRQAERRSSVSGEKPVMPESSPCKKCKVDRPGSDYIYVRSTSGFKVHLICRSCRRDMRRMEYHRNVEESRRRRRAYHRDLRTRAALVRENTPNIDVLRKALIEQPTEMESEAELAAFFRGFVAGAKRESYESERFERLKDLVHRIAAESKTARGIGYEDAVSYGYEGLLVFIRKRVPFVNDEHERKLAAQAIRWAITDSKREFGSVRRGGQQRFPIPESSFVRPDETVPTHTLQDRSGDEPALPEAVASIEIDPRDRRVLEGLVAGMTFDEAGALVGLTGSRVAQRLRELGRKHPSLERALLASV